jgi:Protein of unknown function (DUF2975)
MVTALIAAALLLSAFILLNAFIVGTNVHAAGPGQLAWASRVLAWLTLAAAVALPALIVVTYLEPSAMAPLDLRLSHLDGGGRLRDSVPLDDRMLALAAALIPISLAVWGLLTLHQLLVGFARNDVFSQLAGKHLRALGLCIFGAEVTAFAAEGPITYFLERAHHVTVVAFSLGLEDLVALFAASVVAIMATVMLEATRVADENAKFV